ncbi:serine/threonine-protein kinase [Pendulispora albinea]|uniref:Serine/threonine protein kinase n=1 Tax=Pendulispora albinea TaxID=2741071 RepID=A0ABZ2LNH8_9BACT
MRVTRPRVVGRYALYDALGVGGMGSVHFGVVRDGEEPRPVAAKQLHAEYARDPASVTMLLDEMRLTRMAQHPNVVPVLDFAYDGEQMVLVMEYVHGESLRHLLATARRRGLVVPLRIAAAVLLDVLRALHAAHHARDEAGNALDLVHRDVTPENILVGANGITRLGDFGVAKASGRLHATQSGGLKGKLAYLAPEQLGGHVTARADLYAAALVFWEALAGVRAFRGQDEVELISQALNPKIPPPSAIAQGIPPALDGVMLRALSVAPEDRHENAEAFASALAEAVGTEGVASAAEVGAWTHELAGDKLDERAARLTEIVEMERARLRDGTGGTGGTGGAAVAGSGPASGVPSLSPQSLQLAHVSPLPDASQSVPAAQKPPRFTPFVLLTVLTVACLALIGRELVAPVKARAEVQPELPAAPVLAPPAPSVPLAPASAPAPEAAAPRNNVAASAPSRDVAAAAPLKAPEPQPDNHPSRATKTKRAPAVHRADGCDPPFVVDAMGIRVYKEECFR